MFENKYNLNTKIKKLIDRQAIYIRLYSTAYNNNEIGVMPIYRNKLDIITMELIKLYSLKYGINI